MSLGAVVTRRLENVSPDGGENVAQCLENCPKLNVFDFDIENICDNVQPYLTTSKHQ